MQDSYESYCKALDQQGNYRTLPNVFRGYCTHSSSKSSWINFASNDYLGLSKHPRLLEKALEAGQKYGVGATGSRLLSGNSFIFHDLESRIAQDKNTSAALVFNSGFQANTAVLSALLDPTVLKDFPLVFFDKLNHASLYQGIDLASTKANLRTNQRPGRGAIKTVVEPFSWINPRNHTKILVRYAHNDMDHLSSLLNQYKNDCRPKFIVSETIFGMDGDVLYLKKLAELAHQHKAFVYLDEAHGTGLWGPRGYGLSTMLFSDDTCANVKKNDFNSIMKEVPYAVMGTFSKALGCSGAYIACSDLLKRYLLNKAKGFIYSTAPSPMMMGAGLAAWEIIPQLLPDRLRLFERADFLRTELQNMGFETGLSSSHIIPLILRDTKPTMEAKHCLEKQGILVSALRPPTVPSGGSRLRLALTTQHTDQDLNRLLKALQFCKKTLSLNTK
jgi:8-amino-7-oxononanoate synthase